jgi:hypothetical protein
MQDKNFKQLLDGYYYPVTKRYGFLAAPFEDVVMGYWEWICNNPYFKNPQEYYLAPRFMDCSLREGLDILDPIGYNQTLFCETRSKWTAIFVTACELGISAVAYRLNCQGVEITLIEDTHDRKTDSGEHGCTRLEVIRDARRKKFIYDTERLLYVSKRDGGRKWEFFQLGKPYFFENVECYSNPKIKERFTPQMLNTYSNAMGLDILDENFYCYRKALIDAKIKSPEFTIYEKRTYANYHLERGLKYGR